MAASSRASRASRRVSNLTSRALGFDVLRCDALQHHLPHQHLHAGIRRIRRLPAVPDQLHFRPERLCRHRLCARHLPEPESVGSSPWLRHSAIADVAGLHRCYQLLHDHHAERSAAVGSGAGDTGHRQPARRPPATGSDDDRQPGLREPQLWLFDWTCGRADVFRAVPARQPGRHCSRSDRRSPSGNHRLHERHPRRSLGGVARQPLPLAAIIDNSNGRRARVPARSDVRA